MGERGHLVYVRLLYLLGEAGITLGVIHRSVCVKACLRGRFILPDERYEMFVP